MNKALRWCPMARRRAASVQPWPWRRRCSDLVALLTITGPSTSLSSRSPSRRRRIRAASFVAGRSGEATVAAEFEKHSALLRYLATIDPSGQKLTNSDKISATKHCKCTIADVEHILAKYTWAKDAQKKIEKLKEEGKPLPKTFSEVQNLMGNTPLDVGRSNLAKNGQISRNALCPCGSKK